MKNLTTKECVKLGAIYERLRVNPDYKVLFKWVVGRVQELTELTLNSKVLLKSTEDLVEHAFNQGQRIGIAEAEAYMLDVIKVKGEEEVRLAKKEK